MIVRRTMDEWATLIEAEPTLKHLFVEGDTDQWILKTFFSQYNLALVDVYPIREIEVPSEFVIASPFSSGNRQRVISFAEVISGKLSGPADNFRCLIDKDCDVGLPVAYCLQNLLITDFSNLPVSFVDKKIVQQLVRAVYGGDLDDESYQVLIGACQIMFALRFWRYCFSPSSSHVALYRSIYLVENEVVFDFDDYLQRFAMTNGLLAKKSEMQAWVKEFIRVFGAEPRLNMNSEDFFDIFFGVMKRRRIVTAGTTLDEIKRVFRASMTIERMLAVPVIRKLGVWAGAF